MTSFTTTTTTTGTAAGGAAAGGGDPAGARAVDRIWVCNQVYHGEIPLRIFLTNVVLLYQSSEKRHLIVGILGFVEEPSNIFQCSFLGIVCMVKTQDGLPPSLRPVKIKDRVLPHLRRGKKFLQTTPRRRVRVEALLVVTWNQKALDATNHHVVFLFFKLAHRTATTRQTEAELYQRGVVPDGASSELREPTV